MSLLERLSSKFQNSGLDEYSRVMAADKGLWAIGIPNPGLPAPAHFVPDMKGFSTQHAAIGEEFPVDLEQVAPLAAWRDLCKDLKNAAGRRIKLMTNDDVYAWFVQNAPLRGMTPEALHEAAVAAQAERMSGPSTQKVKPTPAPNQADDPTKKQNTKIEMQSPVNARIQSMCSAAADTVEEEHRMSEEAFTARLRAMVPRLTAVDVKYLRENAPYTSARKFAANFRLHPSGVGPAEDET